MAKSANSLYHNGKQRALSIHNSAILMHDPAFDANNGQPVTPAPPPGILLASHFRASFGYQVKRPAGTRDWLLTFTLAGVGRYRLADQIYLCQAGDLLLLEPGAMHDYATLAQEQPWEFLWAHFLPRPHWVEWLQLPARAAGLRGLAITEITLRQRIEQSFARLLHDLHNPLRFSADLAANALEEILLCAATQNSRTQAPLLDGRAALVLNYLNTHYREAVTIQQLAHQVALSPSRLAHLFKQEVGRSIIETLLAIRLQQAARLLEYTALPINQIAGEVGFQSAAYLARQFTAYYGQSPQAYRQQRRAEATRTEPGRTG